MKLKNEFWAFIPARSGSKAILNKNIKKLNKLPLIAYSILAAKKNKNIKNIVFSSDSLDYYKIAKKYAPIIFHRRSKRISGDNSGDFEVFKDFIDSRIRNNETLPKYFVHLRPTTPLRKNIIINKAINFFEKNSHNYSALKSINKMSSTSYKTFRIKNKKLCSILEKNFNMDEYNKPRSNFEVTYEANGIVDIYKSENIINGFLLGKKVVPFEVNFFNSDIDTYEDFEIVKQFIKTKKFKI